MNPRCKSLLNGWELLLDLDVNSRFLSGSRRAKFMRIRIQSTSIPYLINFSRTCSLCRKGGHGTGGKPQDARGGGNCWLPGIVWNIMQFNIATYYLCRKIWTENLISAWINLIFRGFLHFDSDFTLTVKLNISKMKMLTWMQWVCAIKSGSSFICGMFYLVNLIALLSVLRIRNVYPGSEFFSTRIPSASKNLSILTKKNGF